MFIRNYIDFVQDNKISDDNINNEKDKNTDFDDDSSDMR